MRTTLNIDDDLYTKAVELTGVHEKTILLRESLKALIELESSRLGCSEHNLEPVPRRRTETSEK